jgi:abortive infection bacteriophage resistance protein
MIGSVPAPLKRFLTIDEQIELLERRGMELDGDPARWLRAVNYYRLSGYWYIYRTLEAQEGATTHGDEFVPGTAFSAITALYEFDRKLRTLAHDGIERVEVALRSQVSYVLGGHDPLAHEDPAMFRTEFDHAAWIATAKFRVARASKRSAFIRHHADRYGGDIPIWALVDVLDFADVSILFEGMSISDQFAVAEGLGIRFDLNQLRTAQREKVLKNHPLARWLEQLTVLRNIAAHHGRLWNRKFVPAATSAMRTVPGLESLPKGQSENVFGALCVVAAILETTSPGATWTRRVATELDGLFRDLPERSPREMGFLDTWRTLPLWNG